LFNRVRLYLFSLSGVVTVPETTFPRDDARMGSTHHDALS
jgi:hypothetical protein